MYSLNNITVSFSGIPVFSQVSFLINQKDKIGLVGKNGSGKTTLLKVLGGILEPETGEAVIPHNKRIGYLPQEMALKNNRTVFKEAISAFEEVLFTRKEIDKLTEQISDRSDYESREYKKLLERLVELNDKFQIIGGHDMEGETEKVLMGLGFEREEFDRPLNTFSYGWQMRVELAKILLKDPDFLLLDEPTNHLDIESIQWLESFLKEFNGAVMLVSHDRAFLDNITTRTIEIERGEIFDYKASYSKYLKLREERVEKQVAAFNNQQRQIRQIERFIERFRYKNTKARQVQSRVKMLDKMEEITIDDFDMSSISFRFPAAQPSGKVVVDAKGLNKSYGDKKVLKDLEFSIIKGERIAFVGKNGEGKTTLSKIIAGILDHEGQCRLGYSVKLGYFAQNADEMLDGDITVLETIDNVAKGDIRTKIRDILGGFLFDENDIDKKVKVLSGGEKTRLSLAKLLLEPVNLLILDEPTNHLDMRSKDILKNALLMFEGTLIVVSHDRDFLQGLTNKVFEFRDKHIKPYIGDVYEFLESRKISGLDALEKQKEKKRQARKEISDSKVIFEKKKELERSIRKVSGKIHQCESEIESLELELEEMDKVLASPDNEDTSVYEKYGKHKEKLNKKMHDWTDLNAELESLEKQKADIVEGKPNSP
jgi:ATP-binding cassette subfamily F protein 3